MGSVRCPAAICRNKRGHGLRPIIKARRRPCSVSVCRSGYSIACNNRSAAGTTFRLAATETSSEGAGRTSEARILTIGASTAIFATGFRSAASIAGSQSRTASRGAISTTSRVFVFAASDFRSTNLGLCKRNKR